MDWFNQNDNLFEDNYSNSLFCSNDIDIENVFIGKQHNLADFEVKIEDYEIYKFDSKAILKDLSPFSSTNAMKDEVPRADKSFSKIFDVSKETRKNFHLMGEELDSHLCPSSNYRTEDRIVLTSNGNHLNNEGLKIDSLSNKNGCYELDKSELNFNGVNVNSTLINSIKCNETSKYGVSVGSDNVERLERESLLNNDSCSYMVDIIHDNQYSSQAVNFSHFGGLLSFKQLPLSQRMKIKREKTKILLERKTKREHFTGKEDDSNNNLLVRPEKLISFNNDPCLENSKSPSLKSTLHKTQSNNSKNYKKNELGHNCNVDMSLNTNLGDEYCQKKLKILKNRISAQQSRDKKKREYDDLKIFSQNLLDENCQLKKELDRRDNEIANLKETIKLLCSRCTNLIKTSINNDTNTNKVDNKQYTLVESSRRNFSNTMKYSLMAGFLVIVCLIGAFSVTSSFKGYFVNNFSGRLLNSISTDEDLLQSDTDSTNTSTVNYNREYTSSSKSLMLYKPNENKLRDKYPFKIVKDLNKFLKKNMLGQEGFEIGSLLNKKRYEFLLKMQNKISEDKSKRGFLQNQKPIKMCVETEGLSLNVDNFGQGVNEIDNKEGIILKSNIDDTSNSHYASKMVVPIKDTSYQDNLKLRDNIKTMYVREFITSDERNSETFKDLFEKLSYSNEKDIESKSNEHNNKDDCYYLHMMVPYEPNKSAENLPKQKKNIINLDSPNEIINLDSKLDKQERNYNITIANGLNNINSIDDNNKTTNNLNITEKKVYYEVGCKIFEINKIYK